jgi:hypothetical protein
METKDVKVTDKFGEEIPAELIICPECRGEEFNIYTIGANHNHLQCTACGRSFCQGGCDEVFIPKGWTRAQALAAQRLCARYQIPFRHSEWLQFDNGSYIGRPNTCGMFVGIEKDGYTHT